MWLILFFEPGAVGAQEKSETPSQKTKEAVDKLLHTPAAVAQTLQDSSDTAKAKFRDAVAETKPTKADSETQRRFNKSRIRRLRRAFQLAEDGTRFGLLP